MDIDICKVVFEDLEFTARYSEKIRGYIGNKYRENDLLHNHIADKFIYRYPLVQYKVILKKPTVIGIGEGANIVARIGIADDELILDGKKYETFQRNVIRHTNYFGYTDDYIEYKFLTPWIALSQKNSEIYKNSNSIEKEELIRRILIGNILSMSKGLGYTVEGKLSSWINLEEREVMLKGIKHIGFVGNFKVNFKIPNELGIGKSVSRGFGTIKCI